MPETNPTDINHLDDFFESRIPSDDSTPYPVLFSLQREIYRGSWEQFRKDLEKRLVSRPLPARIQMTIQADLERIKRITEYEQRHGIDLASLYIDWFETLPQ
jgi:hypothetical protein